MMYSNFVANIKLSPPGGERLIYHGSVRGTMVTLRVRLTMQPQHKSYEFLQVFYIDHKMKSHEKRYNDIYRLSSV
jgi:hypothetical protein